MAIDVVLPRLNSYNLIGERTYVLNISTIKKDVLVSRKDLIIFQIGF